MIQVNGEVRHGNGSFEGKSMRVTAANFDVAKQRVAEAERRIARQQAIIAELKRDNHPRAAETAALLLEIMRRYLANAMAYRDRLERHGGNHITNL